MATLQEFVEQLIDLLRDPFDREYLVRQFQDAVLVGESDSNEDGPGWDALTDLATHFEFYQPDPVKRLQDPGLYGDDRLKEHIVSALKELVHAGLIQPSVLTRAQESS